MKIMQWAQNVNIDNALTYYSEIIEILKFPHFYAKHPQSRSHQTILSSSILILILIKEDPDVGQTNEHGSCVIDHLKKLTLEQNIQQSPSIQTLMLTVNLQWVRPVFHPADRSPTTSLPTGSACPINTSCPTPVLRRKLCIFHSHPSFPPIKRKERLELWTACSLIHETRSAGGVCGYHCPLVCHVWPGNILQSAIYRVAANFIQNWIFKRSSWQACGWNCHWN